MSHSDCKIDCKILNHRGLHARASAKFVTCARQFDAQITVNHKEHTVPATSIMGLMMLVASKGCIITIQATGEEKQKAIEALSQLVADKFGED